MGRKPAPQPLTLAAATTTDEDPSASETLPITSPSDARSPRSPRSPFRFGQKKTTQQTAGGKQLLPAAEVSQQLYQHQQPYYPDDNDDDEEDAHFQPISSAIHQQFSPSEAAHQAYSHGRGRQDEDKASKSGFFFNFGKSAKSSDRLNVHQYTDSRSETMSRDTDQPPVMSKQSSKHSDSSYQDHAVQKPNTALPSRSEISLVSTADQDSSNTSRKGKPKPFTLLSRTRSIKDKDSPKSSPKESGPRLTEPEKVHTTPLRTAPLHQHDRSFREMMSSSARNHSADRSQRPREHSTSRERVPTGREPQARFEPSSYKESSGSGFLSGLKSSSGRAADIFSKGLFGKNARSGSTTEKEPVVDDEHYVLKVINLPLVEQTRRTRISKRLEHSRDKTEFWMPAFPWRAIDYLNFKGSDVEGLYRVPGSGPQIKKWQRKFDEELDVNLFEQQDLYDINIIGSMLKAWLRELPDELFPKEAQDRIARECMGSETVPQLLVDELSNLPPFKYYLLFAITCHLSLLLAHSDKNKMDFRNLCICFQPCMKIDAFCFKFLVCDWRDCWKGCKNENKYIEEEYGLLFDQPPPITTGDEKEPARNGDHLEEPIDDRNVSSSDSSNVQSNRSGEQKTKLRKKTLPPENASVDTSSTISTNLTVNSQQETPPRRSGDLRPLSPIKPLSPLGF